MLQKFETKSSIETSLFIAGVRCKYEATKEISDRPTSYSETCQKMAQMHYTEIFYSTYHNQHDGFWFNSNDGIVAIVDIKKKELGPNSTTKVHS